jgi:hypothetical protein
MISPRIVVMVNGETAEETLARRGRKRRTGVECVKRSAEYVCYKQLGAVTRCATPDHTDLRIGKRDWESSMQVWRQIIRQSVALAAANEYVALGASRVAL